MSLQVRCPESGLALRSLSLEDAEALTGKLQGRPSSLFGPTPQILLRADDRIAYPIAVDIPVLMQPEQLSPTPQEIDLRDDRWAEAYDEMEFYNQSAATFGLDMDRQVASLKLHDREDQYIPESWVDASYDARAQLDALQHLGDPSGSVLLQLGGKGEHAVKALLAGAAEAWLVTPMLAEAQYARELARRTGVGSSMNAVVGVAEQLPFPEGSFDAVYAGGCLHHMATHHASPEIYRILVSGGRFAAVEPWQTLLHSWGTRAIGKREANSYCSPLTAARVEPIGEAFEDSVIRHHGPVLRYAALALLKLSGRPLTPRAGLCLGRVDDRLPLPDKCGGSVAILASRR